MRIKILACLSFAFFICFFPQSYAQQNSGKVNISTPLFNTDSLLALQLTYANRNLKKKTVDSSYLRLSMDYQTDNKLWKNIPVRIRARGNFRFRTCYFKPIKMRIKKKDAKTTLFEGNTKLKLVLPCYTGRYANDYIVKEFLAYKLYQLVSPYHFKTRLLSIKLTEPRRKKDRVHQVKGFFIEDIKEIADRSGGKVLKRNVTPLTQDAANSVRNAFFQYMIGNTDFSTGYQHNEKLLFINKEIIPLPYDFDMSGFCNTNYSVVSQIGDNKLPITKVTQRLYRGFKRSPEILEQVRQEFIAQESAMMALLADYRPYFQKESQYTECRSFLEGFFVIIKNDKSFKRKIIDQARE